MIAHISGSFADNALVRFATAMTSHLRVRYLLAVLVGALCWTASASAGSVSLANAPYGTPQIANTSVGTTIGVNPGPAGLYYRATLDPSRTYRLTVMGAPTSTGNFVLRLQEDGHLTYLAAPKGPSVYRISGVTNFEVLLYRDSPGTYLVRSMTLEDCAGLCKTDDDLKAEILANAPGLSSALESHDSYLASQILLKWAAPKVVWASGDPAPFNTAGLSASEIYYDYFQPGYGGVYCGGAADFFHKILNLFGVSNFELDFGTVTDELTHATVIVPVTASDGTADYRIVDPTFDFTLQLINSGQPASLPVALELWRSGLTNRVVFDTGSLADRAVLYDTHDDGQYVEQTCGQLPVTAGCSLTDSMTLWAPYLIRDGFQTGNAAYLQLLGTTSLFTPDAFGVPSELQTTLATFKTAVANSDDSVHIADPPLPPVAEAVPTLSSDKPVVGDRLLSSTVSWNAIDPVTSVSYQWMSCAESAGNCSAIPDATSDTYLAQPSDAGHELYMAVTAQNIDGASAPENSALTGTVATPPAPAPQTTLSAGSAAPSVQPPAGTTTAPSAAKTGATPVSSKSRSSGLRMSLRRTHETVRLTATNLSKRQIVLRWFVTIAKPNQRCCGRHRASTRRIVLRTIRLEAGSARALQLRLSRVAGSVTVRIAGGSRLVKRTLPISRRSPSLTISKISF
jgi:hypothetical protein